MSLITDYQMSVVSFVFVTDVFFRYFYCFLSKPLNLKKASTRSVESTILLGAKTAKVIMVSEV